MKIGMLGLGFMGKTHLLAHQNIPQSELVAVASADPVTLTGDLSAVQGNFGGSGEKFDFSGLNKYEDWQDAIKDPAVEAVDVCLPTYLHEPAVTAALKAGKHVLVEKPMAMDGDEADRILEAAASSKATLMAAQVLRFWPDYLPLMDLADAGTLGTMRMAVFRRRCCAPAWGKWLTERNRSGGGVFDLLIHDVDMMLRLFGKPEWVSASGIDDMPNGVDLLTAHCHYPGGGVVVITGGWHHKKSYPFSMEYTVSFDGGTVEYSSEGREPTLYRAGGEQEKLARPDKDGFQAEIEYFIECASSGRAPDRCPPEASAETVRLTRLLSDSRAKNGEKIAC